MKKIIVPIIIILSCFYAHAQNNIERFSVSIIPIGPSDKPIDGLTLSMKKSDTLNDREFDKVLITDANTLKAAVAYIEKHDNHNKFPNYKDFGSFSVSIYRNSVLQLEYFLPTHKESKPFLHDFLNTFINQHLDYRAIEIVQRMFYRVSY